MKENILLIDDEPFWSQYNIQALSEFYNVTYISDAAKADKEFEKLNERKYKAIVIDSSMPIPYDWEGIHKKDADYGFKTGTVIVKKNQTFIDNVNIPVLILSNRKVSEIQDDITNTVFKNKIKIEVRHKLDTPSFMLPKIVENLIKSQNGEQNENEEA